MDPIIRLEGGWLGDEIAPTYPPPDKQVNKENLFVTLLPAMGTGGGFSGFMIGCVAWGFIGFNLGCSLREDKAAWPCRHALRAFTRH